MYNQTKTITKTNARLEGTLDTSRTNNKGSPSARNRADKKIEQDIFDAESKCAEMRSKFRSQKNIKIY